MEDQYMTTKEVVSKYNIPYWKIQYFLLNRHKNGLEYCVKKRGQHVFLRKDLFEKWLKNQEKSNE